MIDMKVENLYVKLVRLFKFRQSDTQPVPGIRSTNKVVSA